MNKFFQIMGIIFCGLLVVGGIGFGVLSLQGMGLDKESKVYAEKLFPELLKDLRPETFVKFLAEEDKPKVDRTTMERMFSKVRKDHGAFKKVGEIKGEAMVHFTPAGKMVYAKYQAQAEYEKGTVPVQLTLVKKQEWRLTRIDYGRSKEAPHE
jgi:hypothetical protein